MPIEIRELVLTIAVTQPAPDAVQRLSALGGLTPAAEALPPLPEPDEEPSSGTGDTPARAESQPSQRRAGSRTATVAKVADRVYRLMQDDLRLGHTRL